MFNFLCSSKILTQENFDVIINGAYSYSFTNAFLDLSYLRILTQENLNHIAVHSKPQDLVDVFRVLLFTRLRLLCSNNKAKVAALINTNISNLVELFFNLEASDILTQDIFNFVVTHPKLDDLVSGFSILLNQRIKATIIANYICILGNHRDYVRAKNLLPISIQNMLVPKEYYDMREKYLNFIAAFWLGDIFKSLPIMAISHILEFVQIQPMQRQEAMNIMQNIQLPQELDFDVYKNILKDKVDEYTQFQAHLSLNIPQRMLNEKGLFLRLERWSFWTNRHASAELQHAFDKQYGLTIVS